MTSPAIVIETHRNNPDVLRHHLHTLSITELRALAIRTGIYQTTMRRRVVLIEAIVNAKAPKTLPAIPAEGKYVIRNEETRDFSMYLDGQLVGCARTETEADATLDQLVDEIARHTRITTADMAAERAEDVEDRMRETIGDPARDIDERYCERCARITIHRLVKGAFHCASCSLCSCGEFAIYGGVTPCCQECHDAALAEMDRADIDEELAAQGLRLADEDEAGWYQLINGGKHVWVTDEPPRWGTPVTAPLFEEETAPYLAALDRAVTARLPIPRGTDAWKAAQARVEQAHEALATAGGIEEKRTLYIDPLLGYHATRAIHQFAGMIRATNEAERPAFKCSNCTGPHHVQRCPEVHAALVAPLWGPPNPVCPKCGRLHDPIVGCSYDKGAGTGGSGPVTFSTLLPVPDDPCAGVRDQLKAVEGERDGLRAALEQIAGVAGNLSDEQVQRVGGINDARALALQVVHARRIARTALGE